MKSAAQKTTTVPAAEFKAKCLQLMNEVSRTGSRLIVTKHGKPVVEITAPVPDETPFRSIIGRNRGARILGDISKPALDENEWKAIRGEWEPS